MTYRFNKKISILTKRFINLMPKNLKKILGTTLNNTPFSKEFINNWIKHNQADIYLISFPKCGRTWFRVMMGKAIKTIFNLNNVTEIDIEKFHKINKNIPHIRVTHDDDPQLKSPNEIQTSKKKYKNKKVIFLVRSPKDVIVSLYFQKIKRDNSYKASIDSYLHSRNGSINSLITFYNIWAKNNHVPKDFYLLKYEDLHLNPQKILTETLGFIGIKNVNKKIIQDAIAYSSFLNMRKREKKNEYGTSIFQPGNIDDNESYKTRKGKIGGYAEYLNKEQIAYLDSKIKKLLSPYYSYYKKN